MKQLEAAVNKAIRNALQNEVANTVKETEQRAIHEVVYGVYEPIEYIRREDKGGLSDTANMHEKVSSDNVLRVSNNTPFGGDSYLRDGKTLTEVVVTGDGYMYIGGHKGAYAYEQPRDFIQATKEELVSSGALENALKKGLSRQGITLK